jgi:hypothetical protein
MAAYATPDPMRRRGTAASAILAVLFILLP